MNKKVVHYTSVFREPVVGQSAIVTPIDHPDTENVSNTKPVFTSQVVRVRAYPDNGEFETLNTIYRKA